MKKSSDANGKSTSSASGEPAAPQWLAGIEHLTRDGHGVAYWRGERVAYKWWDPQREAQEAQELAQICQRLEAAGIPVNDGSVILHPQLLELHEVAPEWLPLRAYGYPGALQLYQAMERPAAGEGALLFWMPEGSEEAAEDEGGAVLCALHRRKDSDAMGVMLPRTFAGEGQIDPSVEHRMRAENWVPAGVKARAQDWTAWVAQHGFTPKNVLEGLARAKQQWREKVEAGSEPARSVARPRRGLAR